MKNGFLIICLMVSVFANGQEKSMLLKNGYLHVGNGEVIASAAIGIKNGKISLVKNSLAYSYSVSDWDTIIDLKGQHVYPGFVASNSTLGLAEIDAVRATLDFQEVGIYNPHVRSQIAYNVESEVIATTRSNGVLLSQPTPRGGVISGTSSVMAMDGWNWEDATIAANDGVHVNWPASIQRKSDNRNVQERAKDYATKKQELYAFFEASLAYLKTKKSEVDLRYQAMNGCFNGTKRVYFHADDLQQINDIIDFVTYFKLPFAVIVGGHDAALVGRKLKDAKIAVMLYRTHSLPRREEEAVNHAYSAPFKLQEEGVLFCIQNEGDMEITQARNIPFLAGTAMAYGLTTEQAIAAVSLNACKIMGIDKMYGSIEVGKSATLFVSEGNALDMRTNNVTLALINGRIIGLKNKQGELYQKYKGKYSQQK